MFRLELKNRLAVQRGTIYFDLERDEIEFSFFADAKKKKKYICLPGREIRAHQLEASLFTFVFLKIAISERLIAHDC